MRYFEVVLSGDCDDSELSICILGEDKPTISEAELFCKDDISLFKCSGISDINDNLNMYINDHLRMYTSDYALI